MKSFAITSSDLDFLQKQVNVPIIRIVRYLVNGTPIYGYTVPASGFTDPVTGQPLTVDSTGTLLPSPGSVVELGVIGAPVTDPVTGKNYTAFDLSKSSWALLLPPVVTANGNTAAGVGEPFGLRNVQGLFNNISTPTAATWGSAYSSFARSSAADYSHYSQQYSSDLTLQLRTKSIEAQQTQVNLLDGVATTGATPTFPRTLWGNLNQADKALIQDSTYGVRIDTGKVDLSQRYANPFLTVYDYTPRLISQTVDSHEALLRMDAAASGGATTDIGVSTSGGVITDRSVYQIKDINGGFKTDGGFTSTGNATITGTKIVVSGATVTVTLAIPEAVTVTAGTSAPTYKLLISDITDPVDAIYNHSTPTSLVFVYTAPAPIGTTAVVTAATTPINLHGGTIKDSIGKDLVINGATPGTFYREDFTRNLNTLSGDPTLSGWNTLFGQFFDHGLDFIGKGGNTVNGVSSKVYIPLDPSDPFYRAPGTNGLNDPGYTKLSISRATVANPESAGADGMFHTADDIQSPGKDGIYGTTDDIVGPTNPNYINHTSPYIDQSQTYGSNDTVTNLLREWVQDPKMVGQYVAGMKLFDGNTLANSWNQQNPDGTVTVTKKTLPTLNELRAYLSKTGRDDLSWDDINDLRVRDDKGKLLDLDPGTAGIQSKSSGHTLIADFLPRLDAAHLLSDPFTSIVGHVNVLASFNASHIDRGSDTTSAQGAYISDYINLQSGQPTTFGTTPANGAILNEILLRSIGDHYVAGDGRANENFGLTAIHHVWHEDHNWQIDNLIMNIGQQQAADTTKTFAHQWQIAITPTVGDTPASGVTAVAGHYQDIKGNYVDKTGAISWNQEKMFQAATLVVQTEYQHVAIDQYARGLSPNIPLFVQYDSAVNADVTLDYSQVAFRFGHSQLRETIDALDPNGSLTGAITHFALEQAFLNPEGFAKVGPTAIAQGMSRQASSEIDEIVTPALQQKLLGQPQDLAAINIARGRDLGMPTLNNLRRQLSGGLSAELAALQQKLVLNPSDTKLQETIDKTIELQGGLQAYTGWSDFGNNLLHPEALVNFMAAYSFDGDLDKASLVMKLVDDPTYGTIANTTNSSFTTAEKGILTSLGWITSDTASDADIKAAKVDIKAATFVGSGNDANKGFEAIDAWNGGLAEKHVFLGQLGSTFDAIFADQMTRLINGDRFYYFWRLQFGLPVFTELNSAVSTEQFKDVIERTTGAQHLRGDVFFLADSYVELGEAPTSTSSGDARDHKYGDLVNLSGNGVYSTLGASTVLNGTTTQIGGDSFIVDNRPNSGTNPDGTSSVGFDSHEVIGGTKNKDYIDAGDGDDDVYGGDGNDTLLGNAGADHIYGEDGDDKIYGGLLPDFLDGGKGNDEIHGGDDADVLIGSEGNDTLFGENFTDELHGGAGDDYLDGGKDADLIYGGSGQDVVLGQEGLDTTYGEEGDDRMFAGAGPDQLFGGAGDDILNGGAGGGNQNLNVDECLGEFGFNMVSFSDVTIALNHAADLNFQNVNLGTSTPFGQLWVNIQGIEGSARADEIIGDTSANWLIGGGGNDKVSGGDGNDLVVGDSVRLDALIGNNGLLSVTDRHFLDLLKSVPGFTFGDTVTIGTNAITYNHQTLFGDDILNGGAGNDTLLGGGGADTLNGGDGDDTVYGDDGNDVLYSGTGKDHLYGGAGIDVLDSYSNAGTATLEGGTGDDTYAIYNSADVIIENAAEGTDTVWTAVSYTLSANVENMYLVGNVDGSSSTTDSTNNTIIGYGVGNNLIHGGGGADTLNGGDGNDTIYGDDGNDVLYSGTGNDHLYGGAGIDVLDSYSNAGTVTLEGGTGDDTYAIYNSADVIFENANEGTDTVWTAVSYTLSANVENMYLISNVDGSSSTTDSTNNTIVGYGVGNNLIHGGGGADTLNGGDGNDTVYGDDGNDVLYSGTGNDHLYGGAGIDVLDSYSNAGTVTLEGGTGDDTYAIYNSADVIVENAAEGTDTVWTAVSYTLSANVENMYLVGDVNGSSNATDSTNNTIIGYGVGNNLIHGGGGADTLNGGDGNDTIYGDDGNDVLYSGTGNDHLYGGAGIDVLDSYSNAGTVTLEGGNGDDTYAIYNSADVIFENANEGTDTVWTAVSYTLSANVENMYLVGNVDGTGNSGDNTIIGYGSGNNVLDGGGGNDSLIGGTGVDTFVLHKPTVATPGFSTINDFDFTAGEKLRISVGEFGGLTVGGVVQVVSGVGANAANDPNQRFLFDTTDRSLYFDADGNAAGSSAVKIASLTGVNSLNASAFLLVA